MPFRSPLHRIVSCAELHRPPPQRASIVRWAAAVFAVAGLAVAGCGEDEPDCTQGYEGCFCTRDYRCLEDLVCLSERCVDPNAVAEEPGDDSAGGGSSPGSGDDEGEGDNVASCEAFVDSWACEPPGGVMLLDCSVFESSACDVSEYFDCLADNTTCSGGMLDASQWISCTELAECGA